MFDTMMRKRSQKEQAPVTLNLNSMMDMLSIILVFLLSSISSEEQFQLAKDMNLPASNSQLSFSKSVQIKLTRADLMVQDAFVAKVKNYQLVDAEVEGSKIVKLYQILDRFKQQASKDLPKDTVVMQADRGFSFSVLNKVMRTAAMAGYPNFRLAIMKEE